LIIGLCLAVIVYCFAQAYRTSESYLAWRAADVENFLDGINSAQKALNHSFGPGFEDAAPKDREAAVDSLSGAIEKLQKASSPDHQSDQIRLELLRISREQRALLTRGGKMDETQANFDDYKRAQGRLEEWVKTEGSKHGLTLGKGDKQSK
jgi:hypothetical protein